MNLRPSSIILNLTICNDILLLMFCVAQVWFMSLSGHPFCLLMFLLKANSRNINIKKGWPDRDTNRV